MKLNGQKVSGIYIETVVIPRPSITEKQEDGSTKEVPKFHAFKLAAVLDYEDFDKLCPIPEAPLVIRPGQPQSRNVEDKEYKKKIEEWADKRVQWAFLKSISATPGLEWESVDLGQPETWKNIDKELKDAGFSAVEIGRLFEGFRTANSMNEVKMEEARKSFFASEADRSPA